MNAEMLDQRVARGIEWLDANAPEGWQARINLHKFNMADPCRCVLGQVFGDYWDAMENMVGRPRAWSEVDPGSWEIERGFNLENQTNEDTEDHDWDDLERAWVRALADSASWSRTDRVNA